MGDGNGLGAGFGWWCGDFGFHILGLFVSPQPHKTGVPYAAFGGELGKSDVCHQTGSEPVRAARLGSGHCCRRPLARQGRHRGGDIAQHAPVEACAHLALVHQFAILPLAQQ